MPLKWPSSLWTPLTVQRKVWIVLLLICLPLALGLGSHIYIVRNLLQLQQQQHELVLAENQLSHLQRLVIDIEDGFRGYVLTQQQAFLTPLTKAEAKLEQALDDTKRTLQKVQETRSDLTAVEEQLKDLVRSKRTLIEEVQQGHQDMALGYIRSGEGLRLSDRLRQELRTIESRLHERHARLNATAETLSHQTFAGLWIALIGVGVLGVTGSWLLARSLTDPIARLQSAVAQLGDRLDFPQAAGLLAPVLRRTDELGLLAKTYLEMTRRIQAYIREIEALDGIGQDINTIGADGLDGVLHRITNRAVDLVQADVCLVLLRDERMGCWVVEAASGEWNDRLRHAVMLWEEFPVSVQAYERREVAFGEHLRLDGRPEVARRNLIGDSKMAIPLLSHGLPFGVLSFVSEHPRNAGQWNQRLAKGLAQQAALAITNARLYEASKENQRGLFTRLRQLEHLAENLAHDLKGPGSRIEELARLLDQKFSDQLDARTAKWLHLIQENGRDIVQRVEGILDIARVGVGQGSVTAVDPRMVIDDVFKAYAGEIERLRAVVGVEGDFPLVPCHGFYLRQVFDNLFSNALKYARPGEPPSIVIRSHIDRSVVCFSVSDRGIGIPVDQRTRVFQPFVRLRQTEVPGSGIGLAIVRRIVEFYGGQVWIEDSEAPGCTVKFTLPRLGDVRCETDPADPVSPSQKVFDVSGSSKL